MRTPQERLRDITDACSSPSVFGGVVSLRNITEVAMAVGRVAKHAKLGWGILVNGLPGNEWLEVSSHAPGDRSDVVVILRQKLTDEYLTSLPLSTEGSAAPGRLVAPIQAIDAHMHKAMAAHNVCPML